MKPSGKVELLIISIRNPYSHATVPHIVALLGSTFHAAKIRQLFETCKDFRKFFQSMQRYSAMRRPLGRGLLLLLAQSGLEVYLK